MPPNVVRPRAVWKAVAATALVLAASSLFVSTVLYVRSRDHTNNVLRTYASRQAAKVNEQSRERAIDVCNRANPSRAYLRLRALEFVKTDINGSSYTTRISPDVLNILNCELTVAHHGHPIPLPRRVQAHYLALFHRRVVPDVKAGRIVGGWPFRSYFNGR